MDDRNDSEVVDDPGLLEPCDAIWDGWPERPTSYLIALNGRRAFSANSEGISMSISSRSRILAEKDAGYDTILPKDTLECVVSYPFEHRYRSSKRQSGAVRISHWNESNDHRRGNDLRPL